MACSILSYFFFKIYPEEEFFFLFVFFIFDQFFYFFFCPGDKFDHFIVFLSCFTQRWHFKEIEKIRFVIYSRFLIENIIIFIFILYTEQSLIYIHNDCEVNMWLESLIIMYGIRDVIKFEFLIEISKLRKYFCIGF